MHKYGDCSFCEGQVKTNKIELDHGYKGKLYTFKDIPGRICQQCNEKYFIAKVAKDIEYRIKKKIDNTIWNINNFVNKRYFCYWKEKTDKHRVHQTVSIQYTESYKVDKSGKRNWLLIIYIDN